MTSKLTPDSLEHLTRRLHTLQSKARTKGKLEGDDLPDLFLFQEIAAMLAGTGNSEHSDPRVPGESWSKVLLRRLGEIGKPVELRELLESLGIEYGSRKWISAWGTAKRLINTKHPSEPLMVGNRDPEGAVYMVGLPNWKVPLPKYDAEKHIHRPRP